MISNPDLTAILTAIIHAGEIVAFEQKQGSSPSALGGSRARFINGPTLPDALQKAEAIIAMTRPKEPGAG